MTPEESSEQRRIWGLVQQIVAVGKHQKPKPEHMLAACLAVAAEIALCNGIPRRQLIGWVKQQWKGRERERASGEKEDARES